MARLALAVVIASLSPRWLAGQVRPLASPGDGRARSAPIEAAFESEDADSVPGREIFVYSADGRRDPFRPLPPGGPAGPRFEELRLIGVVFSPAPRRSVALVGVSATRASARIEAGERTFRLRQGAVLGEITILRVEPERVIVAINRFGAREQNELRLDRPRGGVER